MDKLKNRSVFSSFLLCDVQMGDNFFSGGDKVPQASNNFQNRPGINSLEVSGNVLE